MLKITSYLQQQMIKQDNHKHYEQLKQMASNKDNYMYKE